MLQDHISHHMSTHTISKASMNTLLEVLRDLQTCHCRSVGFAIGYFPCLLGDSPSKRIHFDTSTNAVLSIKEWCRICSLRSFRHALPKSIPTLIISPATTASSNSNKQHYEDHSLSVSMRDFQPPLWQCVTWRPLSSLVRCL